MSKRSLSSKSLIRLLRRAGVDVQDLVGVAAVLLLAFRRQARSRSPLAASQASAPDSTRSMALQDPPSRPGRLHDLCSPQRRCLRLLRAALRLQLCCRTDPPRCCLPVAAYCTRRGRHLLRRNRRFLQNVRRDTVGCSANASLARRHLAQELTGPSNLHLSVSPIRPCMQSHIRS